MTSSTTKKVVAAVAIAVLGTMGVAGPAGAAPQQARHVWCC